MTEGNDVGHLFVAASREQVRLYTAKLVGCLSLLPDDELWVRSSDHVNSIGNLVLHLCGNLRQWIISGIGGEEDVRRRPEEFRPDATASKGELRDLIETTVEDADRVLARFDVKKLSELRLIQGFQVSCLQAIYSSVAHWSHHVGQIIHITKSSTGGDLALTHLPPEAYKPD